jgi:hypothetical protein
LNFQAFRISDLAVLLIADPILQIVHMCRIWRINLNPPQGLRILTRENGMTLLHRITIRPTGTGEYLTAGAVEVRARNPVVEAARALIKAGANPRATLRVTDAPISIAPHPLFRLAREYRAPFTNHRAGYPLRNLTSDEPLAVARFDTAQT